MHGHTLNTHTHIYQTCILIKPHIVVFMHHTQIKGHRVEVSLGYSYRYSDCDGWLRNIERICLHSGTSYLKKSIYTHINTVENKSIRQYSSKSVYGMDGWMDIAVTFLIR